MKSKLILKELQQESLKILKEVHAFCVENDIKYSVAYGTLIGVMRHKGFIPWDDDIDIIMHRQDYEKFCKTFKSSRYQLTYRPVDKTCLLAFARVFDQQNTYSEPDTPWCLHETGVFIDIFPVDYVSDDEAVFKQQHEKMKKCWRKSIIARAGLGTFSRSKPFLFNIKLCVKKMLCWDAQQSVDKHMDYVNQCVEMQPTKHWSQLGCLDGYEYQDTADFVGVSLFPFEDMMVMVMNGYHNVLTKYYGDYMQLPPETERVGHCHAEFYWKDKS